jgi:hypothetical protein
MGECGSACLVPPAPLQQSHSVTHYHWHSAQFSDGMDLWRGRGQGDEDVRHAGEWSGCDLLWATESN